ncbi:putative Translation initiation factor eIF-2B subunit delta [Paratrimastix pyriformis]|uniref:Translation initiation factor eIF2B subunit delta n=1 Tax=Paratrimastix pyriformis TaxID=342808 RepID=A0ABQ8UJR7_9EUKA|nr:putative Translation initiation factor eIF-2B subunit delta [Paratrimastix pyriformis]
MMAEAGPADPQVHRAVLEVGLKMNRGLIGGGSARMAAMLEALKKMVQDYVPPPKATLARDLPDQITRQCAFFAQARPLSLPMQDGVTWLEKLVANIDPALSEEAAKAKVVEAIDRFITRRIRQASDLIVTDGVRRIHNGDVVLTHGSSRTIARIFQRAWEEGTRFRVVVVESHPHHEGRALLRDLPRTLPVTYCLVGGLSYVMKEVTKVLIGVQTMLSNGYAIARVGTSLVTMAASVDKKPVIVCCESYKFTEHVKIDSFCFNEKECSNPLFISRLSALHHLIRSSMAEAPLALPPHLQVLNLQYDVVPMQFIDMVITEVGVVPPTSVPVVIREYRRELEDR